ncbi:glycosyl hydrolase family 16 [Aquimarina sp. MMG016]|uniref:glycosyl hydrolase family 16 n=1 Tax=Aquimarina sp. MMG016 TaxID=2822690 RepID=UPI001B3A3297|nr:glycosyl hydrolase family 16 [Aquimarina sp. MMG016]MBQ4822344.1 glycosyl hydrolase family 16 [Aquimarina sp. MMG016]
MKNRKHINLKTICPLILVLMMLSGCERGLSDEAVFATFPNTADIYTDSPVGLTDEFFKSFDPALGANPEGFGTDDNVAFEGNSSIRIDVPAPGDANGSFVGGIFLDRGEGRDLTGYDALTFWARGSITATVGLVGFGTDFEDNKFAVNGPSIRLSTDWRKYIIPIPDPSKLIQEKGMFVFSAGSYDVLQNDDPAIGTSFDDNLGFTFWMDELRFENLGTIAQLRPAIFSGEDLSEQLFVGSTKEIDGLSATFNIGTGDNVTVGSAPSYFDFSSSNTGVAFVNELGLIEIVGEGTTMITAQLDGVLAQGSLNLEVLGSFVGADVPPVRDPGDVISIFSDAYTSVNNLNFAAFNDDNVQIQTQSFNGDQIVTYDNLTFVGLGWDGTNNVSAMTHLHLDVQLSSSANPALTVQLIDFGADNSDGGGDDTGGGFTIPSSELIEGTWVSIDIPINGFTEATAIFPGSPNLNNIARVAFVSNGSSFIIDNVYFYRE